MWKSPVVPPLLVCEPDSGKGGGQPQGLAHTWGAQDCLGLSLGRNRRDDRCEGLRGGLAPPGEGVGGRTLCFMC